MSPWKTSQIRSNKLKELYKEWEQKLKDSGFEDAEQTVGNDRVLKQFATNFSRQEPLDQTLQRGRYYQLLLHRVNQSRFLNPVHKFIMKESAKGAKNSDIQRKLEAHGETINIHTIYLIIRRYEYQWGIRKWTAKELGLKKLPRRRIR